MPHEIGAQREQDERPPLSVPCGIDDGVHERAALLLRDGLREQLLELVDRDHDVLARPRLRDGVGHVHCRRDARPQKQKRRAQCRDQPGPEERRLAAPGRADEREKRCLGQPGRQLLDQALAPREQVGVLGLEVVEEFIRADGTSGLDGALVPSLKHLLRRGPCAPRLRGWQRLAG